MNNVIIKDNCKIIKSFIDENCTIEENAVLEGGTIIAENVKVDAGSELRGIIIETSNHTGILVLS